jgi:hypothetical protein
MSSDNNTGDISARFPTWDDVISLCDALNKMGVEYALIGGTAMGVYGYSRQTKDIDLLIPRNEINTRKLLEVLQHHALTQHGYNDEIGRSLEHGVSTSVSDEILVDLLFVAADQEYDDLKTHIVAHQDGNTAVNVLNLDGLLQTKQTTRDSDRADRANIKRALSIINQRSTENLCGITSLHHPDLKFQSTDLAHGLYEGTVLEQNKRHFAQGCNNDTFVIHEKSRFLEVPTIGDVVTIRYDNQKVHVTDLNSNSDSDHPRETD